MAKHVHDGAPPADTATDKAARGDVDGGAPAERTDKSTTPTDDPAAKWSAYRKDFEARAAACTSVDALGELVETEHDRLVDFEKFDAAGRMALREAIAARGKAIHEGKA